MTTGRAGLIKRLAAAAPVLAAAVVLSGCSLRGGSPEFAGVLAPSLGEPLPAERWAQADAANPKGGGSTAFWLLPNQVRIRQWRFNQEATEADYIAVRWHDLGVFVLFNAPLWISVKSAEFDRNAEDSSGVRFTWSPFWSSASTRNPKPSTPTVKAYGVPLLFSRASVESDELGGHFRVGTHLWTLGPFYAGTKFDAARQLAGAEGEEVPQSEVSGWVVLPLMAGGLPGALAWTSYDINTIGRGDERRHVWGHGPFIGWLGYSGQTTHIATTGETLEQGRERWTSRGRSLLGGALWQSKALRTPDGFRQRERNGPLWSFLGWGRRDEAFTIYAFWLPVVLGERKPAPAPES